MRKILEILRLHHEARLSLRAIARSCAISHNTVKDVLDRAETSGIAWPLSEGITENELEAKLYPSIINKATNQSELDMLHIHNELRRKGVTLRLLWLEYKEEKPDGLQYSQFCERYRGWQKQLDVSMRQVHRAGEKMFVDYAGQTVPIIDHQTGEIRTAQIFLAVLGASSYTYVNAYWQQSLPHWIDAHCDAFEYFGGTTEIVVIDNLKSGVKKPCFYEPDLNPTYQEMATHYGVAVIPARVRRPKDKAKVESAVLLAERWILARLRNRKFYSLDELRQAIAEELDKLNDKPFQKLEGCRRSQYETLDKPILRPLPTQRYVFAEWKKATVNIDYHITLDKNYYSVPYQLVHKEVHVRYTALTVEIFFKGERVASHQRLHGKGRFHTEDSHRPAAHQRHVEWPPSRVISWCEAVGSATGDVAKCILTSKPHPEQGYRSCLGLMGLARQYSKERLEAACRRAITCKAYSYQSVKSILATGLDKIPLEPAADTHPLAPHPNIRGSEYYQERGV